MKHCIDSDEAFVFCVCVCVYWERETHFWRFSTLHRSCAAHFADQWAGQLESVGEEI